ncbi:MAG: sigma-54-dependent Fis family transcriptional regulator [Saprospiraceae bacterium]|nr:sigma-54-dependent Fis family transcriptional regulator [Saprospiraceae bacterium]MBK8850948.1 sigma-54-dependent Fis family transcriptional regulator [Saprospiraceae bacterium]MBL0081403.1 sigma-54-dependent Fis family transcriptional regulator [Saprospiraceae bacterium]
MTKDPNINSVKQRFGIIGRSAALDRALYTAVRVATTDLTVLIQGESGVGKEIFSRIIHELSKRKHNGFIAINCGAIPPGTINSELFGHEKGSFTGATGERKGYFETVGGGTIFLDEIGEMPLDTQAYLLRVLETGEFLRVGSSKVLTTDVRVIAATNISLEDQIKKGKFREDLFYRLNTVPIKVPALHERSEDIYPLFRKFSVDFAEKYRTNSLEMDDKARYILEHYRWPGNIRELKNIVEQYSVLSENKMLDEETIALLTPHLISRNLPVGIKNKETEGFAEREILYKFLLDMKADLSDLKNLVFNLIKNNNLHVPESSSMNFVVPSEVNNISSGYYNEEEIGEDGDEREHNKPIIINEISRDRYHKSEIVDEALSLEDMEKDMIKKALKKFAGKRKDAADELGISERTLYRKIKQYDIPD